MEEREKYELIERYLNGQLTFGELENFERLVSSNPELKEEVEKHRLVHELVVDQGLLKLKDKIQKEFRPAPNNGGRWKNTLMIGVAALIGTMVIFYFLNRNQPVGEDHYDEQAVLHQEGDIEQVDISKEGLSKKVDESPQPKTNVTEQKAVPTNKKTNDNNEKTGQESVSIPQNNTSFDGIALRPVPKTLDTLTEKPTNAITEHKAENSKDAENNNKCDGFKATPIITSLPSCRSKNTGKLMVQSIKANNGIKPYFYSIDGGQNFQKSTEFHWLAPDTYYMTIKDGNGCIAALDTPFEVKEEACHNPATEYAFHPVLGETWEFPFAERSSGILEVYSKAGQLVYQVKINNGFPEDWNGTSNNGSTLGMGSYTYIYKENDGNYVRGFVSILR